MGVQSSRTLCGEAVVAVVESTDLWNHDDASWARGDQSRYRRVLREAQVRPGMIEVVDVLPEHAGVRFR